MGSPYSSLIYDDPMSMGRRIALEIKDAQLNDGLKDILT
jgi:5-formaminoimidazole-4-carboxamide-1-(beta)-D-ribofuranosyl 5'-monophosphate synthetase